MFQCLIFMHVYLACPVYVYMYVLHLLYICLYIFRHALYVYLCVCT